MLELTISYRSCSNIVQDHGSTKLPKSTVSEFSHTRFLSRNWKLQRNFQFEASNVFRIHSILRILVGGLLCVYSRNLNHRWGWSHTLTSGGLHLEEEVDLSSSHLLDRTQQRAMSCCLKGPPPPPVAVAVAELVVVLGYLKLEHVIFAGNSTWWLLVVFTSVP